jgi:FkbM family methyltransferase
MQNPAPLARDYARKTTRAVRAAWKSGDREILADVVSIRRAVLLNRLGLSVTPTVFGRPLACSSVSALAYAYDDVVLTGQYDVELTAERPFILDCGANIGLSVLYFRHRYPAAEIVAFEPAPQAFDALARNTAGLDGIRVVNTALGSHDGELEIWTAGDTMHAGVHQRAGVTQKESVSLSRLSAFVDRSVDLLKLDVEGAETQVLQELDDTGALRRVDTMVIEYHHHLGDQTLGGFLSLLENAGFDHQVATLETTPLLPPRSFQDVHILARRVES